MTEHLVRPPFWQHVHTDAGHHLRLIGANGEPILTSEVYVDPRSVAEALEAVVRSFDGLTSAPLLSLIDERRTIYPEQVRPPGPGLIDRGPGYEAAP